MQAEDPYKELFEERAAILEFEAGWPRAIAESEARRMVTRLAWLAGQRRAAWIEPPGPKTRQASPGAGLSAETGGRCWD